MHHAGTGVVAGSQPNSLPFFTGEGQSISLAQSCHPQILAVFGEGFPPGVCILQANQHVITCSGSCENISPGFHVSQITADRFVQLNIGNRKHSDSTLGRLTVCNGSTQNRCTRNIACAELRTLINFGSAVEPSNLFIAGSPGNAFRDSIKGAKIPSQHDIFTGLNAYFTTGQRNRLGSNTLNNPNSRSGVSRAMCSHLVNLAGIQHTAGCTPIAGKEVTCRILNRQKNGIGIREIPQSCFIEGIIATGFRSESKVGICK